MAWKGLLSAPCEGARAVVTRCLSRTGQVAVGGATTHRQLGIPSDGGCWGPPGGESAGGSRGPGGGGATEGSPWAGGSWGRGEPLLNADPLETLFRSVVPPGAATDVPEGEGYPDTKALVGAGAVSLSGFGFLG